jgi:hypothetical protein
MSLLRGSQAWSMPNHGGSNEIIRVYYSSGAILRGTLPEVNHNATTQSRYYFFCPNRMLLGIDSLITKGNQWIDSSCTQGRNEAREQCDSRQEQTNDCESHGIGCAHPEEHRRQ